MIGSSLRSVISELMCSVRFLCKLKWAPPISALEKNRLKGQSGH